jgi:spermidine synthase
MSTQNNQAFRELIHQGYQQVFEVERVLFEHQTEHQHLIIFENNLFGRVMALDHIIQTTERDEFIYHEMFAHVPMLTHPKPERILIIGGGDGGLLREVLRHQNPKLKVTMVEIDGTVIEMAKTHLPKHSQGAFDDPRAEIVIADGMDFMRETNETFDIILSDSTDPMGPGLALFSNPFYEAAAKCLGEHGILVTQNGVSMLQLDEIVTTHQRLKNYFAHPTFYRADVPTYVGGNMNLSFSSQQKAPYEQPEATLLARYEQAGLAGKTRYYHPRLHRASFQLPQYIHDALINPTDNKKGD